MNISIREFKFQKLAKFNQNDGVINDVIFPLSVKNTFSSTFFKRNQALHSQIWYFKLSNTVDFKTVIRSLHHAGIAVFWWRRYCANNDSSTHVASHTYECRNMLLYNLVSGCAIWLCFFLHQIYQNWFIDICSWHHSSTGNYQNIKYVIIENFIIYYAESCYYWIFCVTELKWASEFNKSQV